MDDTKIRNMDEFAALSGLSRPTVSKYFHDPTSVRKTTRAKIEEAMERYDYRPNLFAMNQNRKLTKNVGIVVPYLADPFFAEIARKLEQRCIEAGYRPTLFSAHGDRDLEVEILDTLRSLKPAGVLFAPLGETSDRLVIERFTKRVPTILFDSNLSDLDLTFVGSDSAQFAESMVNYLLSTGARPTFFEMANPSNPNALRRRAGYIAAMEHFKEEPEIVQVDGEGWRFEEIGRTAGLSAFKSGQFKTNTILCSNDRLAIGLLAASYEFGLKAGKSPDAQVRIAGQDDHPFARYTCPPLTTVAQDYEAISAQAVQCLFDAIEGDTDARAPVLNKGRLILRASA